MIQIFRRMLRYAKIQLEGLHFRFRCWLGYKYHKITSINHTCLRRTIILARQWCLKWWFTSIEAKWSSNFFNDPYLLSIPPTLLSIPTSPYQPTHYFQHLHMERAVSPSIPGVSYAISHIFHPYICVRSRTLSSCGWCSCAWRSCICPRKWVHTWGRWGRSRKWVTGEPERGPRRHGRCQNPARSSGLFFGPLDQMALSLANISRLLALSEDFGRNIISFLFL